MHTLILDQTTHADFDLLGELGEGSCGRVWRARQRATGHLIALKQYQCFDAQEVVRREVAMLALVAHPNLAHSLGWWEEEGEVWMALELVPGHNLEEALEQRPFGVQEVVDIGEQVSAALASLHALTPALIHRDVKPKNIVWSLSSGKAVLVDFDAACLAGEQRYDDQGTWGYSPPEQDQGHPVPRSDVSALGITLWELLCGRCPDPVQRHFPALPRGCPAGLKALLRRMLRLEATCRPSAHEVLRSLQAIRQSLSAGSASLSQPTRVPRHLPACWSGRPEQLAHLVVLRSRGPPAAQRQRWLARLHHYSSPPILVRLVRVRAPV